MGRNIFQYMYVPLPTAVEQLKQSGELVVAEEVLQRLIDSKAYFPEEEKRFRLEQEILRRLPAEYPYTREEAIQLVQSYLPDFSATQFDALCREKKIFWRYLYGAPHYFGRFFETLCKTEPDFAAAAAARELILPGSDRTLLQESAAQMQRDGKLTVQLGVRAELELEPKVHQEGRTLQASLPLPRATREQSEIEIEEMSAGGQAGKADAAQRVVFWEETLRKKDAFALQYHFLHTESYQDVYGAAEALELTEPKTAKRQTAEIQAEISGAGQQTAQYGSGSLYIRTLAKQLTAGVTEPLCKAKRFYDFITKNVRYSFMPSYFCLDHMAERCAMDRVGDCGIQALLFLALCEAAEIPAHWESGLKTEPKFIGAHDWVRFDTGRYGYRAADLSYGGSAWKRGDHILHRFYFGNVDPWRMAANARILGETGFPEPEFRADPYDNQVGEMALDGRGLRYEEFRRRKEVVRAEQK